MGLLDRISTLVRANVNDLIDRAEDPEKMLDQILRNMQDNIQMARSQVAAMIAQEKELEADLNETQTLAKEWGDKAKRAVDAGKDDLAREALRRKRDNENNAQLYAQQLATQQQAVAKLKDQLRQLESKYQATLSQRDTLIARGRRARAQSQVAATISTFSPLDPGADLERMERKIRGQEAQAAAVAELGDESYEAQFRELDDSDIEAELAALKSGGQLPATSTASAPTGASGGTPAATSATGPATTTATGPDAAAQAEADTDAGMATRQS